MENRVITISREYGSGGRMVGRKLAEKLGIHCYDADLIQRIVDKSGYSADYVKEIPLIMSKKKANPRQGESSRRSWQTGHGG